MQPRALGTGLGSLPGAGDLGMAEFIDRALGVAPHLRRHIVGVLAGLPDEAAFAQLSDTEAERLLRRVEEAQPEAFDILVQATCTGLLQLHAGADGARGGRRGSGGASV